jgi:Nif-specific regulatory protein
MTPQSSRYDFKHQLSINPHTQAWSAVRRDSGVPCFVKFASDGGDLPVEEKHDLLRQSYRLQSKIRSSFIHTATALHSENGSLFVEYPYLASDRLSEVTLRTLFDASCERLIRLATIVDYAHLLGIVHCDLKLENFRLLKHARGKRLILTDLDNLQESGQSPGHRIFGSVACIPPEILNNDRICGGSDLFSLGCSIRIALSHEQSDSAGHEFLRPGDSRLTRLIENLTRPSPTSRPELLLGGLRAAELIDDQQYHQGLKTVLAMLLLNTYRSLAVTGSLVSANLQRDLFYAVKLYSIPEEMSIDLQRALDNSPKTAIDATRELLRSGEVARCGEYWHLAVPDDVLVSLFSKLAGESAMTGTSCDEGIPAEVMAGSVSESVSPSRPSLRHYLVRKTAMAMQQRPNGQTTVSELKELAEFAVMLQRPREACEYLRLAVEATVPHSDEQIRLLPFYVQQLTVSGQHKVAKQAAADGLKLILDRTHKAEELDLKRFYAWLTEYEGEHRQAQLGLEEVVSESEALGETAIQAKAMVDLAGVHLSSGRLDLAADTYERAFSFISAKGLESTVPNGIGTYASFNFQMARYEKTITLAKLAIKHIDANRRSHLLLYDYQLIALAHTRLGEYGKADHWLGRCLGLIQSSSGPTAYSGYYGNVGWSQMVRGDLAGAELSLYRVLGMALQRRATTGECNALKNLAEVALYRGETGECERLIDETRKALGEYPNQVTTTELDLIAGLNAFYHGQKDLDRIRDVLTSLMDRRCRFYSAVALLVVLLESDPSWRANNRELLQQAAGQLPLDQTPLFRALGHLVVPYLADNAPPETLIVATRHAYRHLEAAGHWFLAMITCSAIARLHFANRQPRLGARFVRQALSLSERLSNQSFAAQLDKQLKQEANLVQERRVLVQSFEGIADILANVGQSVDPLPRLLKFAVDAVEAERGVLLLCGHDNDELHVQAYVGCEANDLHDVVSFSRNIPRTALASMSPVFIPDALADAATNKYKSIVAHNIRSVICVPIVVEGKARGVIYLDHHTIPALFDEEDLTFVKALSKFASLVFDTYVRYRSTQNEATYFKSGLADVGFGADFVTRTESLRNLLESLSQIAASDASVLIRGESGTGKEIICRMIHAASPRRDGPFVKLNCAAIAPTLVESELFGIVDRAATGVSARKGKFEAADGGTLFLDEIGDMPLAIQAKVLHVLEYHEFELVGSNKTLSTDVRFVYATNRDLKDMVSRKEFREDLYFRICGVEIVIPPLRERPEDIGLLCQHFISLFARTKQKPVRLSSSALEIIESYHWPGNVRELRNVIERLSLLYPGNIVGMDELPADMVWSAGNSEPSSLTAQAREKARIHRALVECDWNQSAAARNLGMPLATLRRKIKKYGIHRP